MFDLYYVDGWDSGLDEPSGCGRLLIGNLPTAKECVRQMAARVPVAELDFGPGECVVLDQDLGRLVGSNVRVDPYLMALQEERQAAEASRAAPAPVAVPPPAA